MKMKRDIIVRETMSAAAKVTHYRGQPEPRCCKQSGKKKKKKNILSDFQLASGAVKELMEV